MPVFFHLGEMSANGSRRLSRAARAGAWRGDDVRLARTRCGHGLQLHHSGAHLLSHGARRDHRCYPAREPRQHHRLTARCTGRSDGVGAPSSSALARSVAAPQSARVFDIQITLMVVLIYV